MSWDAGAIVGRMVLRTDEWSGPLKQAQAEAKQANTQLRQMLVQKIKAPDMVNLDHLKAAKDAAKVASLQLAEARDNARAAMAQIKELNAQKASAVKYERDHVMALAEDQSRSAKQVRAQEKLRSAESNAVYKLERDHVMALAENQSRAAKQAVTEAKAKARETATAYKIERDHVIALTENKQRSHKEEMNALKLRNSEERKAAQAAKENARIRADAWRSIAMPSAIAGGTLLAGAGFSLKFASDLQEMENLFNVTMGGMKDSTLDWVNEVNRGLGINRQEIMRTVGMFNTMFKATGFGAEQANEMARAMTNLQYDISSFYNLDLETSFQKISSAIAGEIEPIRRLGIMLDENTLKNKAYSVGIAEQGAELTQAQTVMARYLVLLERTQPIQGDFARTSDQAANATKILQARIKDLSAELGRGLIPSYEGAVNIGSEVLKLLTDMAQEHKTLRDAVAYGTAGTGAYLTVLAGVAPLVSSAALATMAWRTALSGILLTTGAVGIAVVGLVTAIGLAVNAAREHERALEAEKKAVGDSAKALPMLQAKYQGLAEAQGKTASMKAEMVSSLKEIQSAYEKIGIAIDMTAAKIGNFNAIGEDAVRKQEKMVALQEKLVAGLQKQLDETAKAEANSSNAVGSMVLGPIMSALDQAKARLDLLKFRLAETKAMRDQFAEMSPLSPSSTSEAGAAGLGKPLTLKDLIGETESELRSRIASIKDFMKTAKEGSYDWRELSSALQEAQDKLAGIEKQSKKTKDVFGLNDIIGDTEIKATETIRIAEAEMFKMAKAGETGSFKWGLLAEAVKQAREELGRFSLQSELANAGVASTEAIQKEIDHYKRLLSLSSEDSLATFDIGRKIVDLEDAKNPMNALLGEHGIGTDAQINRTLSDLKAIREEFAGQPRIISAVTREMRDLNDELSGYAERQRRAADVGVTTTESLERLRDDLRWAAVEFGADQGALAQINQQLYDVEMKLNDRPGDQWFQALKTGAEGVAESVQQSLGDLFTGLMTRDTTSAGEVLRSFLGSMVNMVNQAISEMVTKSMARGLAGLLSGSSGAGGIAQGLLSYAGPSSVPSYAGGTDYVPKDGLYRLHEGEKVQPRSAAAAADRPLEIVIVNTLSQGSIHRAMSGREGRRVISNAIQFDAKENGQTRHIIRGRA